MSWPGVLDASLLKEEVVTRNHRLADAAKAGRKRAEAAKGGAGRKK